MNKWFSVKKLAALSTSALLVACGGGSGGGDSGSSGQSSSATPNVNAAAALSNFLSYTTNGLQMTSSDSYITSGILIIKDAEVYPFVVGATKYPVSKIKEISLLGDDKYLVLRNKYSWKLHLDASGNPIGLAGEFGNAYWNDASCVTSATVNTLPTSTNASGIWFSGLSGAYHEIYRNGLYAHYCDVTSSSPTKNIEWSVQNGTPNPYFCLTFPAVDFVPKTRICLATNSSGVLTSAPWVTEYKTDGSVGREFKNTTINSPK